MIAGISTPPPGSAHSIARLDGVTKSYGKVTALNHIDFEVSAGEVVGLLGPNGAGKTTAIHLLLGLIRPTLGTASTLGHAPWSMAARTRTGVMLQIAKVPETLTVREHVELGASYYPSAPPVAEALAHAGLTGLGSRLFGKLSGGQQQRLMFALAICGGPELLFLDEPTVGLDVEARRELWQCIQRMAEAGRTVVLTTHHLEEADALASRIVVINHGRVVAEGTPEQIKRRVAGSRVRCTTTIEASATAQWPGVNSVERHGSSLRLTVDQAEPVVRRLLEADPHLTDLEVRSAGLEEALLTLTHGNDNATSQEVAA